ncbi:MAG: nucleotidyltransferase domain-containing protein [Candidatus Aenigmarchaeota archaeon]|nr:nucleotidyltransferase domain-containing protein [Candidatus Aenigmarchaeota archaeon]
MEAKDIKKIAAEISHIEGVNAAYLFGSRATGKQKPYSDIDLCIITNPKIKKEARNEILATSSKKIDTHILSDLPLYIQFRVFKDGKQLFVNSKSGLHKARVDVVRKYLDFQPRLERYYRRILS